MRLSRYLLIIEATFANKGIVFALRPQKGREADVQIAGQCGTAISLFRLTRSTISHSALANR